MRYRCPYCRCRFYTYKQFFVHMKQAHGKHGRDKNAPDEKTRRGR
jgi:hypothetical protein